MGKEYKIELDPSLLKILGPSMYKNIYFILGELIANAWDADAKNVYIIIKDDKVILEDDGIGMSYTEGDIKKYLNVGQETRKNSDESLTSKLRRPKMGRKGLGKLAALSISDPIKVMTVKKNEKSGFVLTTNIDKNQNGKLKGIPEDEINFNYITESGTSIVMDNPRLITHKEPSTIAKNISRIFPFTNDGFVIHIMKDDKPEVIIENSKETIVKDLSTIITLGKEFEDYSINVKPNFTKKIDEKKVVLKLNNNEGKEVEKELIIKGWMGTYKDTTGRKKDISDFQDNFVSLYSNSKIGEFNILQSIGRNTITESYVVGELHVDLFEDSDLPDMATSNREGYITSDARYQETLHQARKILDEIIKLRKLYTDDKNKLKNEEKQKKQKLLEEQLIKKTTEYKGKIIQTVKNSLQSKKIEESFKKEIIDNTERTIEDNSELLGLKSKVDSNKRKVLISHTKGDKIYADLISSLLIFNNLPKEEILYTNSDYEESRIPYGKVIFDYLRDFFVNSYSTQKIHVIYITSKMMEKSWGAVAEVGAGWITKSKHDIFNISNDDCIPKDPLSVGKAWNNVQIDYETEKIKMSKVDMDDFCVRIENIVSSYGYKPKKREDNVRWLKNNITLI